MVIIWVIRDRERISCYTAAMRIAKYIAESGLCSRRKAEEWVVEGRVAVDGRRLDSPAFNVPDGAKVTVDGKPVNRTEAVPRLWLFHKPGDCITSHKDPQGRKTVFTYLPQEMGRVLTVGRLDFNTEGLLLLTNDGDLANCLTHPSRGWKRTYRVRVFGAVDKARLAGLAGGVRLKDNKGKWVSYGAIDAQLEKTSESRNQWLVMTITEGKNREIRNICCHLGLEVNRLIRVAYGSFTLGDLPRGELREVPADHVQKIKKVDS